MKKFFTISAALLIASSVLTIVSCKKETPTPPATTPAPATPTPVTTEIASGTPSNKKSINGYLYASYVVDHNGFNTTNQFYGFAVFADPARDLASNYDHQKDVIVKGVASANIGNLGVGKVTFSGNTLFNSASSTSSDVNRIIYPYTFDYGSQWVTEGNSALKALSVYVTRGFPLINNQGVVGPISVSSDYIVDFQSFISNYDSVTVKVSSSPSINGSGVQKTVSSANSAVLFSKSEISSLPVNSSAYVTLRAFNYSNKTVEDKVYMFELSNKVEKQVVVTP